MNRLSHLVILSLPACLAACASPGAYPSLARRDIERQTGSAEPVAGGAQELPAPAPSADLQSRVERLVGQAKASHQEFASRREVARRAVAAAKGSARASDGWVSGQVALASLEADRSGALTALSEVDQLYADERIAVPETLSPSAALLGSAREQIKAWVDEENAYIAQLVRQLGS